MTLLIALFGALITAAGAVGIFSPDQIRRLLRGMPGRGRYVAAVVIRLVFGFLVIWLADDLRYPLVMRILGGFSIAAAIGILVMGRERLDRLVDWWMALRDGMLRIGMLFALLFGAFLVHASL
jgi:hypothetical protein